MQKKTGLGLGTDPLMRFKNLRSKPKKLNMISDYLDHNFDVPLTWCLHKNELFSARNTEFKVEIGREGVQWQEYLDVQFFGERLTIDTDLW